MNTDRDNFYDWAKARDKTEPATTFAALNRADLVAPPRPASPWRRVVLMVLVGIALLAATRFLLTYV